MSLAVRQCELADANAFVAKVHRHHKPVVGHRFSIRAVDETGETRGVVIVGRPVARRTDQRETVEVTRLATDGTKNACSFLYAAAANAAKCIGYREIQTFILMSEPGTSLKAVGWTRGNETPGKSWSVPSRQREDKHPIEKKARWFRRLRQ